MIARRPIPDVLWDRTVANFPFLRQPDALDAARLRDMASLFLEVKQFSGAQGFEVTDEMAVAVAAQACLPVLHLGLGWYDGFVGIVMHAGELATKRQRVDEVGVVHEFDEVFSGEALAGGPVTLSWQDVLMAGKEGEWAYGVVIHEMAHVIDMRNGEPDGVPPLPNREQQSRWQNVLTEAYDLVCCQALGRRPTALDPYAAEGPDEFFAVACESFFITPRQLQAGHPALYAELQAFFRQDPARRPT